jgi:predicted amidophosphoribosyltransferase
MNCPNCQKALQGEFKFCPYCGAEVKKNLSCPSCRNKVDQAWVTCPHCGAPLKGAMPQHVPPQPAAWPQPNHYSYGHGHHYGSSSSKHHRRRKGFLGHLFSS